MVRTDSVELHTGSSGRVWWESVSVNLLLAPLRPIADVLDLTAEALAAVGTVSVTALGVMLTRESEQVDRTHLRVVSSSSSN